MLRISEPLSTKAIKSSAFQRSQLAEKATTRTQANFASWAEDVDHTSSLYGDDVDQGGQVVVQNVESKKDPKPRGAVFRGAPMPRLSRIHGGIGMHAGYLPGYPASHGCIRLPKEMAIKFFQDSPVGTPVEIR